MLPDDEHPLSEQPEGLSDLVELKFGVVWGLGHFEDGGLDPDGVLPLKLWVLQCGAKEDVGLGGVESAGLQHKYLYWWGGILHVFLRVIIRA